MTERIDNAIEFVSDIYYARVFRLAAKRVGVPHYRTLVDQKLHRAGDLYDFIVDQFIEAWHSSWKSVSPFWRCSI